MRLQQVVVIVGALAVCLAISSLVVSGAEAGEKVAPEAASRNGLALPKIFDFERFKSVFNKSYKSIMEELARKKIFLGRAFRAFLSFVGYKHYQKDTYLKISEMSDWTEAEHDALLTKRPLAGLKDVTLIDPKVLLENTPVANIEDIQAKLNELANQPGSEHIAAELGKSQSRRKRDTNNNSVRSELSVDDIFSEPKSEAAELFDKVASNNPNYQAPELSSFGVEDEPTQEPMTEETSSFIASLPGASFVGSLFSAASSYLLGGEPEDLTAKGSHRSDLPDEVFIDHRESGCFSKPKNQDACGSCYIFSTTGLYEWQYCHETGKKVAFSEQYPLDCGERVKMAGCQGGQEYDVASFYGQFGVELKHNYPYRHKSDICPYGRKVKPTHMGYIRLNDDDGGMVGVHYEYLEEFLKRAPILMGLGVTKDFSDYGGGVDSGKTCKESRGHSMVMVGSGREDGREYWLFRNSYGTNWGLDGYYKLDKRAKNCLLDDGIGYFLLPKSKKTIFDVEANPKYESKYVQHRFDDVMNGKYIPHNPFTYVPDEDSPEDDDMVTPPSDE